MIRCHDCNNPLSVKVDADIFYCQTEDADGKAFVASDQPQICNVEGTKIICTDCQKRYIIYEYDSESEEIIKKEISGITQAVLSDLKNNGIIHTHDLGNIEMRGPRNSTSVSGSWSALRYKVSSIVIEELKQRGLIELIESLHFENQYKAKEDEDDTHP